MYDIAHIIRHSPPDTTDGVTLVLQLFEADNSSGKPVTGRRYAV